MEALIKIQRALKAPKNQKNTFGGYNYRSAEDILEAVKPLLEKEGATLTLSDEMVLVGDRYYIKATAKLETKGEVVYTTAYAREAETKKGMDDSQITGTASSYARKYALNGLFLIDDTKDADTDEYKKQTEKRPENAPICPVCGKPVKPTKDKGGRERSAEQVFDALGMCYECYRKQGSMK